MFKATCCSVVQIQIQKQKQIKNFNDPTRGSFLPWTCLKPRVALWFKFKFKLKTKTKQNFNDPTRGSFLPWTCLKPRACLSVVQIQIQIKKKIFNYPTMGSFLPWTCLKPHVDMASAVVSSLNMFKATCCYGVRCGFFLRHA